MVEKEAKAGRTKEDLLRIAQEKLKEIGLDIENFCCDQNSRPRVKIVCIASDLEDSFQEMEKFPRGQTVMVRTDEQTSETLDAWVETGYFRSRSEAAFLFLREGLKLRASELETMKDALDQLKRAKDHLYEKANEILGKKKESE